jgi:hypothetical protein
MSYVSDSKSNRPQQEPQKTHTARTEQRVTPTPVTSAFRKRLMRDPSRGISLLLPTIDEELLHLLSERLTLVLLDQARTQTT